MVEAGARRLEKRRVDAIEFGHRAIKNICAAHQQVSEKRVSRSVRLTPPVVDQNCFEEFEKQSRRRAERRTRHGEAYQARKLRAWWMRSKKKCRPTPPKKNEKSQEAR